MGQIDEWAVGIIGAVRDPGWSLEVIDFEPLLERDNESRLAVGNGLLGVRGSLEIQSSASRARTYVAGLYERVSGSSAVPFLPSAPDWLRLSLTIDSQEIAFNGERNSLRSRTLDMRCGTLITRWDWPLTSGDFLRLSTVRLVSHKDRRLAIQIVRLVVEGPEDIGFEANDPAAGRGHDFILAANLVPTSLALRLERAEGAKSVWRTASSDRQLTITSTTALFLGDAPLPADEMSSLAQRWSWTNGSPQPATFFRLIEFSPDGIESKARSYISSAPSSTVAEDAVASVIAHSEAWSERWKSSEIEIDGDSEVERATRFAAYHLVSAANPESELTSIGARGLTGDAYSGHVFWDTEIFMLPFYTLTWPEAARSLLMYRYHTLPAARAKASRLGYSGALYAWESADSGEEVTPESLRLPNGITVPVLCGKQEHHISADVAFAVWQYWQATADERFLLEAGAEIIIETARFWASRVVQGADGHYHINKVIGPDEYHETVDDNAYTNVMAKWNLETGIAVIDLLGSRWPERWKQITKALKFGDGETRLWQRIASQIYTGFAASSQLFEQFKGFFGLERIDLNAYEPRNAPMDMLLGRARAQQAQVIKQADVVMLLALLWEEFPPDVRAANFDYYEPLCGHGSSLSPGIHALVAARLGKFDLALRYLQETIDIDLGESFGGTAGGIHIAALGGLWQTIVLGFAGLRIGRDTLVIEPHLPRHWKSVTFRAHWRGSVARFTVHKDPAVVHARLEEGRSIPIIVGSVTRTLNPGQEYRWRLDGDVLPGEVG